jgi:hypothetical protein
LAASERGAAGRRRDAAMALIGRHAPTLLPLDTDDVQQRSDAYYFAVERLGVPRRWLELALAWLATSLRDVIALVLLLFIPSHSILCRIKD